MYGVPYKKTTKNHQDEAPYHPNYTEAGNLYVADFGNFCVVRFSLDDDAAAQGGVVVVGARGKQLMDIDYLKAWRGWGASCDLEGVKLTEVNRDDEKVKQKFIRNLKLED